jgi:hypothetical protein
LAISVALTAGFAATAFSIGFVSAALAAGEGNGFSAVAALSVFEQADNDNPANKASNASRVMRFGSGLCMPESSLAFAELARRRSAQSDRGPEHTVGTVRREPAGALP